jgi:hypothetical protein
MLFEEKAVFIFQNVKWAQYRGGSDGCFITRKSQIADNGEGDYNRDRPSIIATAVPISYDKPHRLMSFTGMPNIPRINEGIDGPLQVTWPGWGYYDSVFGVSGRITHANPGAEDYIRRAAQFTAHAFAGQSVLFDRTTGHWDVVEECQGHRRGFSYPGVGPVLNGKGIAIQYDWAHFKGV